MRALERASDKKDARVANPAVSTLAVGALAFCAALLGIATRPLGFLAVIWPANALLLGLFVRRPALARPMHWAAAAIGLLLAGQVAGDAPARNLWLTAANLVGIAIGYPLLRRLSPENASLRRPLATLYLLLICTMAALGVAVVGASHDTLLHGRALLAALPYWFSAELSNYVIVLPVLLTLPEGDLLRRGIAALRGIPADRERIAPLIVLLFSIAGAVLVGGPGAIAFPVPALLWCSLSYGLFPTSLLVLLSSAALLGAQIFDLTAIAGHAVMPDALISFRLGIALLAIGPLTVASSASYHKDLIARLDQANSLDSLTHVLTRHAYLDRTTDLLGRAATQGIAVMMIDIDHFKRFNDLHGHATGDAVLVDVTRAIGAELRKTDLFGRVGGEEFAVTLSGISRAHALAMAERLRLAVERCSLSTFGTTQLDVTISIGLVHGAHVPEGGITTLMPLADAALYRAKAAGRNCVVACDVPKGDGGS